NHRQLLECLKQVYLIRDQVWLLQ
ncbi:hypothetical protein VCHC17A1_4049B, partial [Vibrio cholerae HC-17A1]